MDQIYDSWSAERIRTSMNVSRFELNEEFDQIFECMRDGASQVETIMKRELQHGVSRSLARGISRLTLPSPFRGPSICTKPGQKIGAGSTSFVVDAVLRTCFF
jgi:hypothetical protein